MIRIAIMVLVLCILPNTAHAPGREWRVSVVEKTNYAVVMPPPQGPALPEIQTDAKPPVPSIKPKLRNFTIKQSRGKMQKCWYTKPDGRRKYRLRRVC